MVFTSGYDEPKLIVLQETLAFLLGTNVMLKI